MIAEFLDTRTYNLVNTAKKNIIRLLANMCTKDEIMSPYDKSIQRPQQVQNHLHKKQRTSRGKNVTETVVVPITEEELLQQELGGWYFVKTNTIANRAGTVFQFDVISFF